MRILLLQPEIEFQFYNHTRRQTPLRPLSARHAVLMAIVVGRPRLNDYRHRGVDCR